MKEVEAGALVPQQLEQHAVAIRSGGEMLERRKIVQEVMSAVMQLDVHYGIIKGTKEPTLYKPGAEVLCSTFMMAPRYEITRHTLENGHREYECRTILTHIPTGNFLGEGIGMASSMESKFRYRSAGRTCPNCNAVAIAKGSPQYGGGWYCNKGKGGCGAKFADGDQEIEEQESGQVENPNIADTHNTIIKRAKKRSLVDAVVTVLAASDMFAPLPDDEDEPDERPRTSHKPEPPSVKLATEKQVSFLGQTCQQFGVTEEALRKNLKALLNIEDPAQIPMDKFNSVLEWVKSHKKG